LRKWGRRSEQEESGEDELATVDRDHGDAPVSSERRQDGNVPLPPRNRLRQEVEEVEESKAELWPRWIEEWGGGEPVTLEHELRVDNGAGGGNLVLSARVGEGVRPRRRIWSRVVLLELDNASPSHQAAGAWLPRVEHTLPLVGDDGV
jgi:hypothetical protein